MSKETEEKKIVDVKGVYDFPMLENEEIRIIITQYSDGSINSTAKQAGDVDEINVFEILGIMDTAKVEIQLSSRKQGAAPAQAPPEPEVQITLDELDATLDQTGQMKKMNLKVGDSAMVPESYAKLRMATRAAYISNKEGEEGGPETKTEK